MQISLMKYGNTKTKNCLVLLWKLWEIMYQILKMINLCSIKIEGNADKWVFAIFFCYCHHFVLKSILSTLSYHNQMHDNYKSDEKILKTLIHRNILPTDPNKKIKLIYYNKFKISNLIMKNNSSPSIGVLQKTTIIYQFKCPLRYCISENNIYVSLTSTTLSGRLTIHLSDTSSIAQFLKNIHAQQQNYGKFKVKTPQY